MEPNLQLLEKLTNACAVSGDEEAVRKIVLAEIEGHADEIRTDALGNLLATKFGTAPEPRPRVMVAAHMDEVGFMITDDDGDGLFRFEAVGGLDERHLVGKPVLVGADEIPGVIGAKPIHLTTTSERQKAISMDALRIDIGTGNGAKAKPGDRATFATRFEKIGASGQASIRAKAIDDRIGVANLITLLKNAPPNIDLLAAFTVQEEVGLRGAGVAAYAFDPDMGIALDSTPAMDLPAWDGEENIRYNTRLGAGPAIYVADGATLSNPQLIDHLRAIAEAEGIPYQIRQPGRGGTDAGAIHRQRSGIPSISVSVPARYLHTAVAICRVSDWENTLRLLFAALEKITVETLERWRV